MPQTEKETGLVVKKTFSNFMILKILMYTMRKYECYKLFLRVKPTPIFSDTK